MKKLISLRTALTDPDYFGAQLAGDSWTPWKVLLLAIPGEQLEPHELAIFQDLTKRTESPAEPVHEFAGTIFGRRGGKSRSIGVLSAYLASGEPI